jgi:SEC-C motif
VPHRGRNAPCYCGSGEKFKDCCLSRFYSATKQGEAALPLHERNNLLLEAIHNIFDLPATPSNNDFRGKFSAERITELYEYVGSLWPKETDVYALLPDVGEALTGYFLGEARPEDLLRNVIRLSLYVDHVFVLDPFLKPWRVQEKYRPTLHPEQHRWVTLRLVLWALALEPWIRSGIVTIIPDPFDFDDVFIPFALNAARSRGLPRVEPRELARLSKNQRDEMFGFWLSLPESYLARVAREQGASEAEIEDLSRYLAELRRLSPFPDLPQGEQRRSQLYQLDIGGPIEDALLICQLTGSFPYSDIRSRQQQLELFAQGLPSESNIWTPLSSAFTALEFRFLNNVNLNYVDDLRHQDRPSMMRSYLRRLWRKVVSDSEITDAIVRDFTDELAEQYRIALEEWRSIEDAATANAARTAIGSLTALFLLDSPSTLLAGRFAPFIPAAGFAALSLIDWWQKCRARRTLRKTVPLSIFIELDDH